MTSTRVPRGLRLAVAALVMGGCGAVAGSSVHRRRHGGPGDPPASARDWHATVRDLASLHFRNPAWGYSHCLRDYALARELASADHVVLDDDVLFAAAYLHDVAAFPPWEDGKLDHSDVGARVVDRLLKGTGFPMDKIGGVRGAIRHPYVLSRSGRSGSAVPARCRRIGLAGRHRGRSHIRSGRSKGGDPTGPKAVAIAGGKPGESTRSGFCRPPAGHECLL